MSYKYGVLKTEISSEADKHNDALLGECALGIEVTVPTFASRCGLGNLDPQHGEKKESSAIEQALTFSPLPPDGTCLVTIRPDKDSFGAMAVLTLRARGEEEKIDTRLVAWIGLIDRMGFHNAQRLYPELKPTGNAVKAIQMIINATDNKWPTIEQKVGAVAQILTGEIPQYELDKIAALKTRIPLKFVPEFHGVVAFLEAPYCYREARDWCNKRFSVAVIYDPNYCAPDGSIIERWSVIRKIGHFDRSGFEQAINQLEAKTCDVSVAELIKNGYGWGGPKNIVSSSMRKPSALNKVDVIGLVIAHTVSGIVS